VLLLVVPCAVAFVLLGRPIVSALLEHGNVTAEGADRISSSLVAFSVGLPFFCVYLLAMRGFYAHQDTRRPFFINLAENAVNIVLAVALVGWLGAAGLALAFALAYVASSAAALAVLHRRHGGLDWSGQAAGVARIVGAAAVMALAVLPVALFVGSPTGLGAWVRLAVGGVVGVVTYVAASVVLRVPELRSVGPMLRRG
jgi:putative peptidoglycan lipid II flippase